MAQPRGVAPLNPRPLLPMIALTEILAERHRNPDTNMKNDQLLQEIRDANMTYLILAQRMLRDDTQEAMYRLGIGEEVAEILADLSPGQMLKIASMNTLLCQFRFNDEMIWDLLTSHSKDLAARSVSAVHAAILMNTRMAEAA